MHVAVVMTFELYNQQSHALTGVGSKMEVVRSRRAQSARDFVNNAYARACIIS